METLKIEIKTDPVLEDALSDYLIGMFDAAIECTVLDDEEGPVVLRVFLERDVATIDDQNELAEQIMAYGGELAAVFDCGTPSVSVEVIEDRDWAENWKVHFKPFEIVDGLVIAPTWEPYAPKEGEQVIVMDPGMAFGTGHHATTRLCLELMVDALSPGCRVLDVGTGTGILAMAALLNGAAQATAIDNDKEAVLAARKNGELNSLAERMDVSDAPLERIETGFDCVIANIVHDVLVALSHDLAQAARTGGFVLLSGLIEGEQSSNLVRIFAEKGFQLKRKQSDEPWCALLLQKIGTGDGQ